VPAEKVLQEVQGDAQSRLRGEKMKLAMLIGILVLSNAVVFSPAHKPAPVRYTAISTSGYQCVIGFEPGFQGPITIKELVVEGPAAQKISK
jgi:hypothetical protein